MKDLYCLAVIRLLFSSFQFGFRPWGCSCKPILVNSIEKLVPFLLQMIILANLSYLPGSFSWFFDIPQLQKFITVGD